MYPFDFPAFEKVSPTAFSLKHHPPPPKRKKRRKEILHHCHVQAPSVPGLRKFKRGLTLYFLSGIDLRSHRSSKYVPANVFHDFLRHLVLYFSIVFQTVYFSFLCVCTPICFSTSSVHASRPQVFQFGTWHCKNITLRTFIRQ